VTNPLGDVAGLPWSPVRCTGLNWALFWCRRNRRLLIKRFLPKL